MTGFNRHAGCVCQPLGVIQCSTLGYRGTALLPRKTRVKGWVQKQDTHIGRSISEPIANARYPGSSRQRLTLRSYVDGFPRVVTNLDSFSYDRLPTHT